jgi:hypothetical protein
MSSLNRKKPEHQKCPKEKNLDVSTRGPLKSMRHQVLIRKM